MKNLKKYLISILLITSNALVAAHAGDDWYVSSTVSVLPGVYSNSVERDSLLSTSLSVNADYLDEFSVAMAYDDLTLNFKDAGAGAFDVTQNSLGGRIQYHVYSDSFAGKLTLQLAVHTISNNDPTGSTDNVEVIAPKIAYINSANDLYYDFEYVTSKYKNTALTVQQLTPSIGFGFNLNADWLHIKAFLVTTSDKTLSQGEDSLTSVDIRWTRWLSSNSVLGLNDFFVDVLLGERIFAVDTNAFSVYNLADVQQGSLLVGLGWKFKEGFDLNAIIGVDKYENKTVSNTYNKQYLYISLTKHW